jgi:glycosyltransferase involved in cell wall biosynthesis
MNKPLVLVTAPITTRSGYGNHSRDICRALIESDKYDVKINSVRWGNTPMNALEDDNKHHQEIKSRILPENKLDRQPDLHFHIVIPNEFQPIAKRNIGVTAGIEATIPAPQWLEGINRMDMTICTSDFTKSVFQNAEFTKQDEKTGHEQKISVTKPMETLFEGFEEIYKTTTDIDDKVNGIFEQVEEDFCFLYTGHWLQGGLGKDRKDTGMLVKVFLETFKDQSNPPALVMKTSGANFSIIDRNDVMNKIKTIKKTIQGKVPNIYLVHGDFTDKQMNELYNHPKVKAHVSFTHGEGFGRPLLEAAQSGKPIIASNWSGHLDFLHGSYCSLIPGSMTSVPRESFPKEMHFKESQWFTVNYQIASQILKDVFSNYKKYKTKAEQLKVYTQAFSFEKMKERLVEMIEPLLESVPQQVSLNLPKLKKMDKKPKSVEQSSLKLPSLKKKK